MTYVTLLLYSNIKQNVRKTYTKPKIIAREKP